MDRGGKEEELDDLLPLHLEDKDFINLTVTQPFYESRVNWVVDPAPPASRRPVSEESAAPTTAHKMPPSGEGTQPPRRQKSRRRRRRKAKRSANQRPVSRPADVMTQAAPTANSNSAHWRATRPRSEANDHPEMRSTPVKLHLLSSVTASHLSSQSEWRKRFLPGPL